MKRKSRQRRKKRGRKQESDVNEKPGLVSARGNLCCKARENRLHLSCCKTNVLHVGCLGFPLASFTPPRDTVYCCCLTEKCHLDTARGRQLLFSALKDVRGMGLVRSMFAAPLSPLPEKECSSSPQQRSFDAWKTFPSIVTVNIALMNVALTTSIFTESHSSS